MVHTLRLRLPLVPLESRTQARNGAAKLAVAVGLGTLLVKELQKKKYIPEEISKDS